MVPNGWKLSTIEEIAKVSSGGTPSRKNDTYWNGNIPWVTTAEVQFKVIKDTSEKITEEGLANSSAKLFPVDTILMAMYGQGKTRGQVAKLGIEASTNQACAAIVLNPDFEVDYYYQFLVSQYENIREMANSGGQENLSGGIVKSIQVPVPPLPEQKKIAQILSTWDKAITTIEQLLANRQQQKKALMQQLLTGKKRLLDENGVRFEGEWKDHFLGEIVEITTSGSKSAFVSESGHNFIIDMGSVSREGKLIPSKRTTLESDFLEVGQLVMPKDDIGGGNIIGRVGLILEANKYVLADHVYAMKVLKHDSVFIGYLINSNKVNKSLRRRANGTAQLGLGKNDVEKQVLHMPASVVEQQKIAAVLSTADQEISALQQKIDALKQEKKALMQQLLTGKRRVQIN